jgi:hypothetical protein
MTLQIELIKAHVMNRPADAAEPFFAGDDDNGTGPKEFESATFGMLLPPQPPTGLPRRSYRFAATPHHQHHRSPRRARPVGAAGSQLHHANNAPAAPDGLAPSELKVRSYPTPPTPLQPPTGLSRRAKGFQLHHATNAPTAPDGLAPSELKAHSYPTPPTPPQPPTGSPRRS